MNLFVPQLLQSDAKGVESRGNCLRGRGQKFAKDQGSEVALALGKSIAILSLKEGRHRFVKGMFVVGRLERSSDRTSLGVADILGDLVAQCSFTKGCQSLTEGVKTGAGAAVLRTEGIDVAKLMLVDER